MRNLKSLSSVKSVVNDLRRRSIFVSINPKYIHIDDKKRCRRRDLSPRPYDFLPDEIMSRTL